jgi:hypothetical protein
MMVGSLSGLSFRFGLMNSSIRVIGWGVDGVQLELFLGGSIDYIVKRTSWDDDSIASVYNVLFLLIEDKFGFAFFDAEELVYGVMHFIADLFSRLQTHDDQLGKFAGVKYLAEIAILLGQFLDIAYITRHKIASSIEFLDRYLRASIA